MENPVPLSALELGNIRRALRQCDPEASRATVVIPAHNEPAIASTLQSIAKAIFAAQHVADVIVVANDCSDNTADIAEDLGAHVVIENRKGVSYARQRGLEEARGSVILSTDADTRDGVDWVSAHLRHYTKESIVGVGGGLKYDHVHPSYRIYRLCARTIQSMSALVGHPPAPGYSGCNSSFRKSTAMSFGGYEPGTNRGEDGLLSAKLRAFGDVVSDASEDIHVTTSGRRYSSFSLVAAEARRKLALMARGRLYTGIERGQDFEDIR